MKNWKPFELAWIIIFVAIGTAISINTKDSFFNYIVLITGIGCVVLAAKGNIWTYGFGFINSILYAYTAYKNNLYGEVGLNILFYVPTNILGFILWKKHLQNQIVEMKKMKIKKSFTIYFICVLSIFTLGFILSLIPSQNTPYIDASTNIIGITATLLMMNRYREQWILYISLNILTITMWSIRMVNGSTDGSIMVVMWGAFLVNAVFGYYNWSKNSMLEMAIEYA